MDAHTLHENRESKPNRNKCEMIIFVKVLIKASYRNLT